MKKSIVRLNGTSEDAEPVTTMDDVARTAGISHRSISRTFRNHLATFASQGAIIPIIIPSTSKHGGRPKINYYLNRIQALYLAQLLKNDLLHQQLARLFDAMIKIQVGRRIQHAINVPTTNALKDAIHNNRFIKDDNGYHNVFTLINKRATGLNSRQQAELNRKNNRSLRFQFSREQNVLIGYIESALLPFLHMNYNYQQIKMIVEQIDLSNVDLSVKPQIDAKHDDSDSSK